MSNVGDLVEKVTSLPGLKSPTNLPCWSRSRFSLAVRPSTKPDSAKRLTDGSDRLIFLRFPEIRQPWALSMGSRGPQRHVPRPLS